MASVAGAECPALPVLRRMYGKFGTFGNANGLSKARHLEAEGITVAGGVQVLLYGYMMKMGFLPGLPHQKYNPPMAQRKVYVSV